MVNRHSIPADDRKSPATGAQVIPYSRPLSRRSAADGPLPLPMVLWLMPLALHIQWLQLLTGQDPCPPKAEVIRLDRHR